jgi:serine protease AprX
MRYAIVSKGMSMGQMEARIKGVGGRDIRHARLLRQLFCELTDDQARRLSREPGLVLKPVKEMRSAQVVAPSVPAPKPHPDYPMPSRYGLLQELVTAQGQSIWDDYTEFRALFDPPLTGEGLTVAVLDSGIRKSHNALSSKVVYERNFTESPGVGDVFGHGTQVAFVAAGMDNQGQVGVSPGAKVMNIKVLNDNGKGTDETVVGGIEEVIELVEEARANGVHPTADLYPNVINLSLGSEDDGDPDNPVRVACREAVNDYGLDVISAAGNQGPKMTTVMLPAVDELVIAVGAVETGYFTIWEKSGRGPTREGVTKPDFVIWGTSLEMASNKADDEYVTKSGTSFACPMVSGLYGLLWEATRRSYGPDALFRWTIARDFAPYYCTKPADAAIRKDNTYGYGLPALSAMAGQITQVTSPLEQTVEMFPPIMMMGVMGVIVRGMF